MKTRYHICILLILTFFLSNDSLVLGARVAGEEGVTPVTPGTEEKVQVPPMPVKKKPVPTYPVEKKPVQTESNNNRKKEPVRGKKDSEEKKAEKRSVSIDFDNVDIAIFIKFISELTGKNFVIDKGVSGKVTVISPTKISVDEAYKVFESVLEVQGYATVPAGNIIKIVPAATAKSKNIETRLRKQAISPEDKVVTQLIPLKYADPDELKKLFMPFVSKNSLIVPYAPTGTLIVTDVLSNIKRLIQIIEEIDVEGIGEQVSVIPLEYATASVLAKSLSTIFQRTAVKGKKGLTISGGIKITSDERTNALIILASEDDTRKIKQLIRLLDTEIPRGEGDIHVYYLQNANAEDLAAVLKAIPSDQKETAKKGKAPVVSKDVEIVADKATNALVITASKSDYLVLESVIKKLDIARRMVYIEALLMEVSVNKDFNLGVEWRIGKDIGSYQDRNVGAFGASTPSSSGISIDKNGNVSLPVGLAMGVLGEGITIGDITFPSIAALIHAYKGDSDIHILSTPQIMTMDNEEAEIIVAENIPYITRAETSTVSTDREYQSYEFKDVGTTLTITPQINQERFVRLEIFQEVAQVVSEDPDQVGLATTLKRQAKTTVVIKDGHTIVIGGLIDETLTQGTSTVPCLGNIPGLGWLFKSTGRSKDKTNLYIFITPHIVENPEEAREVYEDKRDDIESVREGVIKMYKKPWSDSEESEDVEEKEK